MWVLQLCSIEEGNKDLLWCCHVVIFLYLYGFLLVRENVSCHVELQRVGFKKRTQEGRKSVIP